MPLGLVLITYVSALAMTFNICVPTDATHPSGVRISKGSLLTNPSTSIGAEAIPCVALCLRISIFSTTPLAV